MNVDHKNQTVNAYYGDPQIFQSNSLSSFKKLPVQKLMIDNNSLSDMKYMFKQNNNVSTDIRNKD